MEKSVMINTWELLPLAIDRSHRNPIVHGKFADKVYEKFSTYPNQSTNKYDDGCARVPASMSRWEEILFLISVLPFYSFFIWLPLLLISLFVYLPLLHSLSLLTIAGVIIYAIPYDSWPPRLRYNWLMKFATQYFSYRIILEQSPSSSDDDSHIIPIQSTSYKSDNNNNNNNNNNSDNSSSTSDTTNINHEDNNDKNKSKSTIYAMGPHGVAFALAPSIQSLLNDILVGENTHTLGASVIFYIPLYNILLKLMGFISVDRKSFLNILQQHRSVVLIPGGIAEMFTCSYGNTVETLVIKKHKGFIRIALETGANIVPCYCFGNSQTFTSGSGQILQFISRMLQASIVVFWGRYGLPLPHRVPLLTVIGKPIKCPKIVNPSQEMINKYHTIYMSEIGRIYAQYSNAYNWQSKPLILS